MSLRGLKRHAKAKATPSKSSEDVNRLQESSVAVLSETIETLNVKYSALLQESRKTIDLLRGENDILRGEKAQLANDLNASNDDIAVKAARISSLAAKLANISQEMIALGKVNDNMVLSLTVMPKRLSLKNRRRIKKYPTLMIVSTSRFCFSSQVLHFAVKSTREL